MKKYYEAYDDRYRIIHEKGLQWSADAATPSVLETIVKYGIGKDSPILEIGCGEGRDAKPLMDLGYDLYASDVSEEAVRYCRMKYPEHTGRFFILDCLNGILSKEYRFIYAVAVLHMLTEDDDRKAFYGFIKDHLVSGGIALICSMGDGEAEFSTDSREAFDLKERDHFSGRVTV
ncbi:MAG: class I SAM-dependent methyltransferase, partial [Lachnospiraceae bacterium]|nr:class I SAM-dependent methyltransferase [Lachnospiraceae bacterium]